MGDASHISNTTSRLALSAEDQDRWNRYKKALSAEGFSGEITDNLSARLVGSTDNSIYQRLPLAVIYPGNTDDINRAVRAARGIDLTLSIRGGGTGTNGQSLTPGVVLDVGRHLSKILDFNPENETVTVEPGVILARLNAFLRPHGFFFPPTVSTATRATIGGMVATDASGKGSRIYGRTSDYVLALDVALSDGTDHTVRPQTSEGLQELTSREDLVGAVYSTVKRVVRERAAEIARVFPDMNRGLTGYNLQNLGDDTGGLNLIRLLAGSEGTLALTKKITLKIKRLPKIRQLLVIRYGRFHDALQNVQTLLPAEPAAIEVLDDKVLARASQDVVWATLEAVLGTQSARPVEGMSFVEFVGDDEKTLLQQKKKALQLLESCSEDVIDFKTVSDQNIIAQLWTLREKSVGLLGRPEGQRQGVAFVEDTAVPPENLPAFVAEFRDVLDRHGLTYGMFGHADVGCLHVRPYMDMTHERDRKLIRLISNEVVSLTLRYGGLIWGEHGRGYRGEFSPLYFGETLYAELCNIKQAFDPEGLFNRGKLASSQEGHIIEHIDTVPFKGSFDADLTPAARRRYGAAVSCNGNGACFNKEPDQAMCPSYKATGDKLQSPKGRATLLRSWARLRSLPDNAPDRALLPALTEEVKTALDTCLSCKACATQCPIRVDIPAMRSRFLRAYYATRKRSLRDRLIYVLEPLLKIARATPRLSNIAMQNIVSKALIGKIGLIDLPILCPTRHARHVRATPEWLHQNSSNPKAAIILQDSFTGSFDGSVIDAAHSVLTALGFDARLSSVWDNGKARHVRGYTNGFAKTAQNSLLMLEKLGQTGIPLISVDAATGLMFAQEYQALKNDVSIPNVVSLEAFLRSAIDENRIKPSRAQAHQHHTILPHCTEQGARPQSSADWVAILSSFGLSATAGKAGCCGMAGLFGHEKENAALSRTIFDQNWASHLKNPILATGYSCRCQTKRYTGKRPMHPIEWLNECLLANTEKPAA
ncbi:oxidoreductase [Neokomagataea thailandica NBRC 106555]|uniref:D-2-hydroxyglutarate dehydrogenase n=2 Tax=Neokomagataea TaxID=1223423 RepID=A0A4Y6V600_9PROT|nr:MULTISPECIES: FAD-binding and (Fe-S)-binding domain-containing protein [Neokomagataea]QDH23927.1 FAD-binding oxidoreductase [Neokomagataea tanensis]GBR54485.1 oxidoreductase [Neokomagataea thailandica NBRC 106555]